MKFDPSAFALDTQNLARLRTEAKDKPDDALKAAAQQFEAVFLNMMLKSMRETTSQDGLFDNEQTKLFTGMLDQQLSQSMANRGIGLADMMIKQLGREQDGVIPQMPENLTTSWQRASEMNEPFLPGAFNNETQQNFVDKILPDVLAVSKTSGLPPQLIMGQAALESGWGRHEIQMADGSQSFNLFGVKAGANWQGKVAEVVTTEYRNGVPYKQVDSFRAYGSYQEALQDYAGLITDNPRYAKVLQQPDINHMAQEIQRAGYATDPRYAEKLISVMAMLKP